MVVGSYCHGNLPAQRASPIGHNPVENKLVPWCEEIGLAFSSERGSTRRSQAHSCRDKQRYLGGSIVRTVVVIVLNCYGCPHPAYSGSIKVETQPGEQRPSAAKSARENANVQPESAQKGIGPRSTSRTG
jgi:hypothetical protein